MLMREEPTRSSSHSVTTRNNCFAVLTKSCLTMLRPVLRAAACSTCRSSLLRPFLSESSAPTSFSNNAVNAVPRIRQLSSFDPTRENVQLEATFNQSGSRQGSESTAEQEVATPEQEGSVSDLPWYLQVEPPRHLTLLREETPLPDLPEDSPRVLEPLLKFVADDLGLDELNLMDLRSLDRTPALGPKLLMLFGTARSERHLHVSADRLVRWLRGRGVQASADGLQGRNELKIKLRRKARRARLLGNTAVSEDDGITTHWVCVNLGTIGLTAQETTIVGDDGTLSGFGTPQTGTTIVVQIFTETKRQELGLETLWGRILDRSNSANAAEVEPEVFKRTSDPVKRTSDPVKQTSDPAKQTPDPVTAALRDVISDANPGVEKTSRPSQRRYFSSSARRTADAVDLETAIAQEFLSPVEAEELSRTAARQLASHGDQKVLTLKRLRHYIANLTPAQAFEALRKEAESPFLRLCRLSMQNLPSSQTWELRVWLHATALALGNKGYGLAGLKELLAEMKVSGIEATRDLYLALLRAIFSARAAEQATIQEQAQVAVELFDTMYERGDSMLAADTLVTAIAAIADSGVTGSEAERVQAAFEQLMVLAKLPCLEEGYLIRLLDAYASQGNWERFWETWRMPPRSLQARSPNLYTYLYQRLAATKHQSRCIDAIRSCFQEMINEEPPVRLEGSVLEALKACIRVADPQAERIARSLVVTDDETRRLSNREFVRMWKSLDVTAQA